MNSEKFGSTRTAFYNNESMLCLFRIVLLTLLFQGLVADNGPFLLETEKLPSDLSFMPSISNGHLGLTVFGDAIYMNGVYNGHKGDSRRARLPNWLNISVSVYASDNSSVTAENVKYSMNLKDGYFQWWEHCDSLGIKWRHRVYAHRYYNRALIYEFLIRRHASKGSLTIELQSNPGSDTKAFDLVPEVVNSSVIQMLKATTKEVENEHFQPNRTKLYVAFTDNLHEKRRNLELKEGQHFLRYRFVLTADIDKQVSIADMTDVLARSQKEIFEKQRSTWNGFWNNFRIDIKGNLEMSQIINAGIFYMTSSLPSIESNQPNNPYYGLSPTGLSRGQFDADYEGHNFWDTEIWMLPVVTQFHNFWSKELFTYRLKHVSGAKYYANLTGYAGARFPWESAFTGTEATNPCCPEVAQQEIHISADIAVALRNFHAATFDRDWLCRTSWPLVREIAAFLTSRTELNRQTDQYHIKNVMGPDEDHENVDDNVYTNVVFKEALRFASYTQAQCSPNSNQSALDWMKQANKMFVLYDPVKKYHPQHLGYRPGEEVKQADTILLGYPLQFETDNTTRRNDLLMYENVTRQSGPAMTWSMFAINFLDIGMKDKADHYFKKGYIQYIRPEFKVWSENKVGYQGSANFLTGVGGYLQSIINGYAGIRFQLLDNGAQMTIKNVTSLPETTDLLITGIKFANSSFALQIRNVGRHTFKCLQLGSQDLEIVGTHSNVTVRLFTGFTIQFKTEVLAIRTI